MRVGREYLRGSWSYIRKGRLVRVIRKLIEGGMIVKGVKEIFEEGWKILSEIERGRVREEEEEYLCQLYLLKLCGIQKCSQG